MKLVIPILCCIFIYCLWRFVIQNSTDVLHIHKKIDLTRFLKVSEADIFLLPVAELTNNINDIKLFDDVAKLLFEKKIRKQEYQYAEKIQADFLNKMPFETQTEIKRFDLGEWSIYWIYQEQSLEYYVSKYGIFYTHVDATGIEHKQEFRCST